MTRLFRLLLMAVGAAIFASVAATPSANAESLKEIRAQEAENAALRREVGYTNSVCDLSLDASIDWGSAKDWPPGVSIVESCDGALAAVEAICRSDAGKSRVQSLRRFVCAGDGAGPSLSGGTLRYGAAPRSSGFSDTMAYLESRF